MNYSAHYVEQRNILKIVLFSNSPALLREEILRQEFTPNYAFKLPTLIHNVQAQETDSISDNPG